MSSKVFLIDKQDLFGNTSKPSFEGMKPPSKQGWKKKDLELIAGLLGVEYPKKKEEKKDKTSFVEQLILTCAINYFLVLSLIMIIHEFGK